jgi:molybdopterin molybdotransferase
VVAQLGSLDLWRLNLKPGKPLACGRINQALFLGLPGNPVSTIVTFLLIARPALLFLAGCNSADEPVHFQAELITDLHHSPGREEYQRGSLTQRAGKLVVAVNGEQSSNRLASFSDAQCLIRVPKMSADLQAGELVDVYPLKGLMG